MELIVIHYQSRLEFKLRSSLFHLLKSFPNHDMAEINPPFAAAVTVSDWMNE